VIDIGSLPVVGIGNSWMSGSGSVAVMAISSMSFRSRSVNQSALSGPEVIDHGLTGAPPMLGTGNSVIEPLVVILATFRALAWISGASDRPVLAVDSY